MESRLFRMLCVLVGAALAAACSEHREVDEICDNGVDDDGDEVADCADTDCAAAPACEGELEICDNGVDDDGDDDTDCDDDDCGGDPACPGTENCHNDDDDDGDGDVDCDDSDCEESAWCEEPEDCNNGVDDDGDDDVDCDDIDCASEPECHGEVEADCSDGRDDDDDGLIDCDDPDCIDDPDCEGEVEICGNGLDDDGDGDLDCADAECAGDPVCVEDCDDGEDNDADGLIDCGDDDCDDDPACGEDCLNGVDDDGDALVDCMDPSCDFDLACIELCNGLDDDGDGRIDEFPTDPRIGADCYGGPPELAGIGACVMGVNECFGGEVLCQGWAAPTAELCDGLDNDCDGTVPPGELEEGCGTVVTPGELTRIELETAVRDVDVHIDLDTTGSMGEELAELRSSLSTTIVPQVRAILPTAAFGVSTFDDFPFGAFGVEAYGDMPFILRQRITTSVPDVQAAIDAISTHNGQDLPESGLEALYQIATGEGVTWPGGGATPEDCDDWGGADEDGDGLAGCDDPDCVAVPACSGWPREDCGNGVSDDGDPYVDCNDPDCSMTGWVCRPTTEFNCGNLRVDLGEECDDGDTDAGDGCDAECQLENGCGNGYFGSTEECDDGNRVDGDGCAADCTAETTCGNGVVEAGEQCDGGAGCGADCLLEPACGNAVLDAGEDCDDGNTADGDGCASDCTGSRVGVPAFDWTVGYDPGLGHGTVGGVGFREAALPMIVHITDASSHDAADYDGYGADAHDGLAAIDALDAIGASIIGVRTGDAAMSTDPLDWLYPLGMTMATNAVVPVCAFDGSAPRTSGVCADGECCTGIDGAGVAPLVGDLCPLVFDTSRTGTGLGESVVAGIEALSRYITYSLTLVARDDGADAVDATCFVEATGVASATGPGGDCDVVPALADIDGDGTPDTVTNATPRSRVTFEIEAVNQDVNDVDGDGDTTETCAGRGSYGLFLDVVADGRTVVASRRVTVDVP